jgi:hypothetical protein
MQGGFTMRTTRVLIIFGLVALIAAFVGCSDDKKVVNTGNLSLDQQAITDLVNLSSEFEHDVVSHSVPDTTAATLAPTAAATERWFWWRQYTSRDRQVTVTTFPADSVHTYPHADVTVSTTFTGSLHIVHRDINAVYVHTSQPISDVFTQTARFEQWFSETSPNRGWQRTQISNILGGSSSTTVELLTVNVDPATSSDRMYNNETFMDLYDVANKLDLEENEQVNLWAQSGTGTNRLFRHDWAAGQATRVELTNQDFGFYSDVTTTPSALSSAQAERHLVIDVIAPGVIETGATYDAVIWAVPYLIHVLGTPQ